MLWREGIRDAVVDGYHRRLRVGYLKRVTARFAQGRARRFVWRLPLGAPPPREQSGPRPFARREEGVCRAPRRAREAQPAPRLDQEGCPSLSVASVMSAPYDSERGCQLQERTGCSILHTRNIVRQRAGWHHRQRRDHHYGLPSSLAAPTLLSFTEVTMRSQPISGSSARSNTAGKPMINGRLLAAAWLAVMSVGCAAPMQRMTTARPAVPETDQSAAHRPRGHAADGRRRVRRRQRPRHRSRRRHSLARGAPDPDRCRRRHQHGRPGRRRLCHGNGA